MYILFLILLQISIQVTTSASTNYPRSPSRVKDDDVYSITSETSSTTARTRRPMRTLLQALKDTGLIIYK